MKLLTRISLALLSAFFTLAGLNHFRSPELYLRIMPDYLPQPLALVYLSGFFEIVGGLGMIVPGLRAAAGWGLIVLLIAVFPANVHMLIHADQFPSLPYWILVIRLPLQGLLIAWVWWTAIKEHPPIQSNLHDE